MALKRTAAEIENAIAYAEFKRPTLHTDFAGYLYVAIAERLKLSPLVLRQRRDAEAAIAAAQLRTIAPASQVAAAERAIAAEAPRKSDQEYFDSLGPAAREHILEHAKAEIGISTDDPEYAERLQRRVMERTRAMRNRFLPSDLGAHV